MVIMLTVTDASGYQLVANVVAMAITEQNAAWRQRLCEGLARLRQELIWNPYVNPFGPDDGPEGSPIGSARGVPAALGAGSVAGLPDYERLARLMGEANRILAELAKSDTLEHPQPSLHELMKPIARRWATLEAATGSGSVSFGPSDGAPGEERD